MASPIVAAVFLMFASFVAARDSESYEQPPFNYSAAKPNDAVAALQRRVADGTFRWAVDDRALITSLLQELRIPAASQVVVFSKTSLQRSRISPEHPRAIYFSDSCYVGWVPSGLMEVVTVDPVLGPMFYALDPAVARTNATQALVRDSDCLRCHGGTFVRGIPGVFVRSLFTDDGGPLLRHGSEIVDFRTAFTNRWGGWYVTGRHGQTFHRGNVFASETNDQLVVDFKVGANVTDLAPFFDTSAYLTNSSDIVALLVLEHQTAMQNTLTRASLNCRRMLDYQRNLQRELKETVTEGLTYESVRSVFESSAQEVVDDLLFQGEATLPAGIEGSPAFQAAFRANARKGKGGTSVKDFSLQGHLFQNRCSYMIYSESFAALPALLKDRVFGRMLQILKAPQPDARHAYLSTDERERIIDILRDTLPEFAAAAAK